MNYVPSVLKGKTVKVSLQRQEYKCIYSVQLRIFIGIDQGVQSAREGRPNWRLGLLLQCLGD